MAKYKNPDEYQPLSGFYDLRAFDMDKKTFLKFWGIQRFLFKVETDRRAGKIHPQIEEVRNFSGQYQHQLFQHRITKPELI